LGADQGDSVTALLGQLADNAYVGVTRFLGEDAEAQLIENDVVDGFAVGFAGDRPADPAAPECAGIHGTGHRIFRAEDSDLVVFAPLRLVGDDFADVEAWDRKRLAGRFQRDVRGVVRTN